MSLMQNLIPSLSRTPATRRQDEQREPSVKPRYDLRETDEAWGLQIELPGVAKDGLEFTAEEGQITIRGRRQWKSPENWTALYRETGDAPYELLLTHDNTIDVGQIHAELKDGILRVSLPKSEAVKPRKINVS
jgi:HSP20 family protein